MKNFKQNYFIIPMIIILINQISNHLAGYQFNAEGISTVELIVYVAIGLFFLFLQSIPVILFWNRLPHQEPHFNSILGLFVTYAILDIAHSYLFHLYHASAIIVPRIAALALIGTGLIIVTALWKHGLHLASYLSLIYLALYTLFIVLVNSSIAKLPERIKVGKYIKKEEIEAIIARSTEGVKKLKQKQKDINDHPEKHDNNGI